MPRPLKVGKYDLDPLEINDKFKIDPFIDPDVKTVSILPPQDYSSYDSIVSYVLNDMSAKAGYGWKIIQWTNRIWGKAFVVGYIAYDLIQTTDNARLYFSYSKEHISKETAVKIFESVLSLMESDGIKKVTVFPLRDDEDSPVILEALGFSGNRREAIIRQYQQYTVQTHKYEKSTISVNRSFEREITSRVPLNMSVQELENKVKVLNANQSAIDTDSNFASKYMYIVGRYHIATGNLEEAMNAFKHSNTIRLQTGKRPNYEILFWFAKIKDARNEDSVLLYFDEAIKAYEENDEFINLETIKRHRSEFVAR